MTIDYLTIQTAHIIGWIAFVLIGLCLVCCCLALLWKIIHHVWSMKLLLEAVKEHRAKHPERWKRLHDFYAAPDL